MSHPDPQAAVMTQHGSDTSVTATALAIPPRSLRDVEAGLAPLRRSLVEHELYRRLESVQDLVLFTEHHVFAVWDFMSLLKSLQRELTCVDVPWVPQGDPIVRRRVNEWVLAEESDALPDGRVVSHLELYLEAMGELGADTSAIRDLLERVGRGAPVVEAITQAGAPCHARSFVQTTWRIVKSRSVPMLAAAFALGREDLVPAMFAQFAAGVAARHPERGRSLAVYLDRHIDQDGHDHGPAAKDVLERICGDDPAAWADAYGAARATLKARLALWDGVLAQLGAPLPSAAPR